MHQFGLKYYATIAYYVNEINLIQIKKNSTETRFFNGKSLYFNHRISFDTKGLVSSLTILRRKFLYYGHC